MAFILFVCCAIIYNVDDSKRVTSADAQFNILHTCLVLDGLGHCAKHLKINFKSYVFRTLHKVLLKLGEFLKNKM